MVAGKIKISLDNLDDAEGVVIDDENETQSPKKDIEINKDPLDKKTSKKSGATKKAKPGRPAKKKTDSSKSSPKEGSDELAEEEKKYINGFINKINVSLEQKEDVMQEIQKRHKEDGEKEKEDNVIAEPEEVKDEKEELKFSSLAPDEKNNQPETIDHLENSTENIEKDILDPDNSQSVRSIGLYRKIAIFFLIATALLLAFVFYFLFASVTISIIPDQERINNNMILDIYDSDINDSIDGDKIAGVVKKNTMDFEATYTTTGEDVIGEQVSGEVVIYNYYTKNQPLVATTRLMSPDGRIYRIRETVNVPVDGEVRVEVYADEASINMEIGPTKFVIPGLWAGIQDKIYAESFEKIEYSQRVDKFVTQNDIDNAIRDLKQKLVQKAKLEINKKYEDYSQVIYSIDDNTVITQIDAERGDKVDEFEATITANIVAVAFDGQGAASLAEKKFVSTLPDGKELIEFSNNNIIYSLDSFDYNKGLASINATFEGRISMDANSDIIEKEKILGLNKEELDAYLMTIEGISGYNIEFFPSFIKRVPDIPDKIIIKPKL